MSDTLTLFYALAAVSGVASHLLFFIHGEHHLQAPLIFRAHLLLASIVIAFLYFNESFSVGKSISHGLIILGIHTSSLLLSIFIYRTAFHPLRKFPGPFPAKISKLWHTAQNLNSQNHLLLENLHEKYGDIVRTGPNEVTVFLPEAIAELEAPRSTAMKADWYDLDYPGLSLTTARDPVAHKYRRKIWDHGFSEKALNSYEPIILEYCDQLEQVVAASGSNGLDMSVILNLLVTDIMGEFAFSKSFGMLKSQKWGRGPALMRKGITLLGPFSSVPWLARLAFSFPMIPIIRDWNAMMKWADDEMHERISTTSDLQEKRRDVSSWLIEASESSASGEKDTTWLHGDSITILVAGSQTTASTLIYLFYYLALYPQQRERLIEELKDVHTIQPKALQDLPHLNGIINETLRLQPAVPTGGMRLTPAQGFNLGSYHIPGGVNIACSRYSLGRLESCFEQAENFVPERWYSKPEMVKNKRAFLPFATGRYNCVGKNVALMQLRCATATLVKKFDFSFAPDDMGQYVCRDMQDHFTVSPGKMNLIFTPRQDFA